MFDRAWEEMRAEARAFMKNKKETLLKTWLTDIGYKEPIGYEFDLHHKVVKIYSRRPGLLIGKAGVDVNKLKAMLTEEFHGEWKVQFIEVRDGFMQI